MFSFVLHHWLAIIVVVAIFVGFIVLALQTTLGPILARMWASLILPFIEKFGGWIVAIISVIATIATIWFTGRKVGEAKGEVKQAQSTAADHEAIAVREVNETREAAAKQIETVKGASDVKSENASLGDAAVTKRLQDEYSRD